MSELLHLRQPLELHNAGGQTVGIVLTPKAVQDLTAERDRLRAEVAELRQSLEAAREELRDKAAIAAERDLYLQHLEMFWAERVADMDKIGVDGAEGIAEIEAHLRERGMLDGK